MKLWLDDVRPAPEGYKLVKSVSEAKIHCCQMLGLGKVLKIEEISLDHDAGEYAYSGGDYINLLNWLEEKQAIYNWNISNVLFTFHSANPVGVSNMKRICKKNGWRYI